MNITQNAMTDTFSQITGSKKLSEEQAALFAVRVRLPC